LELKLVDAQREQFRRREPHNPDAYVEYLMGQALVSRWDEDHIRDAMRHFERAIELEPNYSAAIAGLVACHLGLGTLAAEPMSLALTKAKELAPKALELDEGSPEAHLSLSMAAFYDYDWSRSEAEVKRALELNPSYADAHIWYATILEALGPMHRAVSEIRRALELDPLSVLSQTVAGGIFRSAKMYDEALAHFKKALEMESRSPAVHNDFGWALISMGKVEEGVQEIEKAADLSGSPFYLAGLGEAYAAAGRRDEALRTIEVLRQLADEVPEVAMVLACIYGRLGDNENSLYWLEIAYRKQAIGAFYLPFFTTHPAFELVRQEPRYKELVRKMGLDKYQIT
jgi:tetratricopeptide (TPR) repeat protein